MEKPTSIAIPHLSRHKKTNGFSLIELLVTMAITTTGLVGVLQMEMKTVRWNNESQLRSIAMLQVQQLVERMHANKAGIVAGKYSDKSGIPSLPNCRTDASTTGISCSAAQIAQFDLSEWNTENALKLPLGAGSISPPSNGVYTITINWQEIESSGSTMNNFTFEFAPLP